MRMRKLYNADMKQNLLAIVAIILGGAAFAAPPQWTYDRVAQHITDGVWTIRVTAEGTRLSAVSANTPDTPADLDLSKPIADAEGNPYRLVSIGGASAPEGGVFAKRKIKALTLGSFLTDIGDYAFYGSGITTDFVLPPDDRETHLSIMRGDVTGMLVIPEGITHIGQGAFNECKGITALVLPQTLKTVGEGTQVSDAFSGCTGVTLFMTSARVSGTEGMFAKDCSKILRGGGFIYGHVDWCIPDTTGRLKVGVIRWDAYVGDRHKVGLECERILSGIPLTNLTAAAVTNYHFRVPWYGKILPDNKVLVRNTDRLTVEREIRYAKAAGIDYWATVWYGDHDDTGLSLQRNLWTQSLQRNALQWCHVFDGNFRKAVGDWTTPEQKKLISDMVSRDFKSDMYLKADAQIPQFEYEDEGERRTHYRTETVRPVLYIIWADESYADCVNALYAECAAQGVPEPFVVIMTYETDREKINSVLKACRASAISSYAHGGKDNIRFARNAASERDRWAFWKTFDTGVIPSVTAGWDNRPRYHNGCSWYADTDVLRNAWIQYPTPDELQKHTEDAITFATTYGNMEGFKSILIYAWNEYDEGGFIAPTLFELRDPANKGRPIKLDAINRAIQPLRDIYTDIQGHFAENEIRRLASSYVFSNYPTPRHHPFQPDEPMRFEEYIVWLVRTFGLYADIGDGRGMRIDFRDAIRTAEVLGFMKGALQRTYRESERQGIGIDRRTMLDSEAIALTANVLKLLDMPYDDEDVFRIFSAIPEQRMTRAKAAVLLVRCLELN